jgi:hypothetical protein
VPDILFTYSRQVDAESQLQRTPFLTKRKLRDPALRQRKRAGGGQSQQGRPEFRSSGAGFVHPTLLALDASGNVWVTQFAGVNELIGLAGPVLTPIQACLKTGKTVCRP